MENKNEEISRVPANENSIKGENNSNHVLSLQDLYKAAFIQEAVHDFSNNPTIVNAGENNEIKYYDENNSESELEKSNVIYKSSDFDETYQLYALKGFEYTVDFVKPESSLDLNELSFDEAKVNGNEANSGILLSRPYDSFQAEGNSVLDLDKGIQIHLVKSDGTPIKETGEVGVATITSPYANCEYTGDAQILQRYLCDSANALCDSDATVLTKNSPAENVSPCFVSMQSNKVPDKSFNDSESVGVNPETLGVRFEDCDFNSSDSFASTESIIPKNIKCPKCPKKFMFKSDLLRHDKYKHSVKPKLSCKYCNKEFVSQQNLLFHEKSHKKKRCTFKCELCKKVFKKSSILMKHTVKKHSTVSSFPCTLCNKVFSSQAQLATHLKKCHVLDGEKRYKCDMCSKSFERKQGLNCHVKAHHDEPLYNCQYCNKAFSKVCYLKNHLKCHPEAKDSFVCDTCGKDFKTSNAWEEHSRKHTGEKPFTCNVCMKSFAYKAYFKVHIRKHTETKPYQCSFCGKSFSKSSDLNRHEKIHAKEKTAVLVSQVLDPVQVSLLDQSEWKDRKNDESQPSQEVYAQTLNFSDAGNLQNLTLENVNLIVNQGSFGTQQPILLTSIGSLIHSNSVPVILTQNPSGPYSVSSIT